MVPVHFACKAPATRPLHFWFAAIYQKVSGKRARPDSAAKCCFASAGHLLPSELRAPVRNPRSMDQPHNCTKGQRHSFGRQQDRHGLVMQEGPRGRPRLPVSKAIRSPTLLATTTDHRGIAHLGIDQREIGRSGTPIATRRKARELVPF